MSVNGCGAKVVLLVEDDCSVREVVAIGLRGAGYSVLEAGAGGDALALARSFRDPVDLLITDVRLPGCTGQALFEALRRWRPGLKAIFMSGGDPVGLPRGVTFLGKPFRISALLSIACELVGPARASSCSTLID